MAGSNMCSRRQLSSGQASGQCNKALQNKQAESQSAKNKHQAEKLMKASKTPAEASSNSSIIILSKSILRCKYQLAMQGLVATYLVASVLVAFQLAATTGSVHGAQSEVWSEVEGLRMKYSTNHDDLLSTKGSDLSLSTDRHEQRQAGPSETAEQASSAASEPEAGSGGEESSPPVSEKSTGAESSSIEAANGSSGGESGSPTSASDGEEEAQDSSAANAEQGADSSSSSRLNAKVPPTGMGRVQSYSASSQHSFKQSHRTPAVIESHQPTTSSASGSFSKARSNAAAADDDQSDDEQVASRHTFKSTKATGSGRGESSSAPVRQRDLTFEPSEPSEKSDNESASGAAALSDDPQAAVDEDADDMDGTRLSSDERSAKGSYGASKFKQPSRLFKEAVRMTSPAKTSDEDSNSSAASSEDDDEASDKSSSSGDSSTPSKGPDSRQQQQQQEQDESNRDSDDKDTEYDGPQNGAKASSANGGQDNMIDFGQYPTAPMKQVHQADITGRAYNQEEAFNMQFDGQPAQVGGPEQQTFGGPASAFIVDQEDESANSNQFRPPFYDNSGQSSRSTSTSTARTERIGQSGAQYTQQRQHNQQQTNPSPLPLGHASRASGGANPQAYKQLSYFKSVTDHQNHQSAPSPASKVSPSGPARLTSVRSPPVPDKADADSPDNVRDNFISPGHYPGSMAHLTQAASEVKANSAPESLASSPTSVSSVSSSKLETNLVTKSAQTDERTNPEQHSSQQATVGGDQQQADSTLKPAGVSAPLLPVSSTTGEPRKADELPNEATPAPTSLVSVTPVPESLQEESQQIMAPILMSTTTMAPMLSTTSPAISSTAAPGSITTTTGNTSQAPSLKRFKFRKYR